MILNNLKMKKIVGSTQQQLMFNVKSLSLAYIAHFLAQDFSNILRVFLVGVLLFTPHSRNIL